MKRISLLIVVMLYGALCFSQALDELRVGIIGGGPSGLTAAWELKKKGYEKVVVLERGTEVGGKVKTVMVDGLPYEMGAVITAPDYEIVLELAKDLGVTLVATPPSVACSRDGETCPMIEWSKEKYGWTRYAKLMKDFLKFSYYVVGHSDFYEPGFAHTPEEMNCTFEEFMHEQHMSGVLETFRPIMVGCGYGFAESMPAAYWMKLMKTFGHEYPKDALFTHSFYKGFSNGWQELWQKLVEEKGLDVRLKSNVVRVEREHDDGTIKVVTETGDFIFDRIIITVPQNAADFLVLTPEEHEIFSQIRTLPYKVTLAKIEGLPRQQHIWLRENSYRNNDDDSSNDGKPVLISSNQDSNVYQIYQFTESTKTSKALLDIMQETVEAMGARVINIVTEDLFNYFPHFGVEAFSRGVPQRLGDLQGKKGTYYTGAAFNFETVELSAQHARAIVREHF